MARASWLILSRPRVHALPVGVDHDHLADPGLAHAGLDLGAVADHDPDRAPGRDDRLGGGLDVAEPEGADLAGVALPVVVRQAEAHELAQAPEHRAVRLPAA